MKKGMNSGVGATYTGDNDMPIRKGRRRRKPTAGNAANPEAHLRKGPGSGIHTGTRVSPKTRATGHMKVGSTGSHGKSSSAASRTGIAPGSGKAVPAGRPKPVGGGSLRIRPVEQPIARIGPGPSVKPSNSGTSASVSGLKGGGIGPARKVSGTKSGMRKPPRMPY